jgi:hypothetical protein
VLIVAGELVRTTVVGAIRPEQKIAVEPLPASMAVSAQHTSLRA